MSENTGKKSSAWKRLFVTDDKEPTSASTAPERDQRFNPEYERGLKTSPSAPVPPVNAEDHDPLLTMAVDAADDRGEQAQVLVERLRSKLIGFGGEALAAVEANDKALMDVMPDDAPIRLRAAAAIASKEHDLASSLQKARERAQSEMGLFSREAQDALQHARTEVEGQLAQIDQEKQSVRSQIEALNARLQELDTQADAHTQAAGQKALLIKKRQEAFSIAHARVAEQIQKVQDALGAVRST